MKKHHIGFGVAISLVCVAIGLVTIKAQANNPSQVEVSDNNQHQLPDEMNPKLNWVEHKLDVVEQKIKDDAIEVISVAKEEVAEEAETIHAIAMRDNKSQAKPIYDYTTGTSN